MYLPPQFAETRAQILHELIRSHPLGTLVVVADGALAAHHIPFLLHPNGDGTVSLRGHVARANPLWRHLDGALEALVVFHGPDAYISPRWYPSLAIDGRVVPTWNYAVVHAYGSPRAIADAAWLSAHLAQLVEAHEGDQPDAWRLSAAPADYLEQMIGGIVGIEMPIARLEGKWKVSQNRTRADQLGVVAGLKAQGCAAARAMAELVERHLKPRSD